MESYTIARYTGRKNTFIFFLKKKFTFDELESGGHHGTNHINQRRVEGNYSERS